MIKVKPLLGVLIVTALLVSYSLLIANDGGPSSASGQAPTITPLAPKDAYTMIQKNKNNKDFVVLDVRTPEEFTSGHIEGAINIDYNSEGFKTEVGKQDKKKTYIVYCRTGRRTSGAVKIMTELGFNHIYVIKGDIVEWQAENLPLVR
jgi:rhodanese-related sulfurtransferase